MCEEKKRFATYKNLVVNRAFNLVQLDHLWSNTATVAIQTHWYVQPFLLPMWDAMV